LTVKTCSIDRFLKSKGLPAGDANIQYVSWRCDSACLAVVLQRPTADPAKPALDVYVVDVKPGRCVARSIVTSATLCVSLLHAVSCCHHVLDRVMPPRAALFL
jgi:hypothetical protein